MKKRKVLNNNALGILLTINALLLIVSIVQHFGSNEVVSDIAHASSQDEKEAVNIEEKRKNDDNENSDEETFSYTFEIDSVAHFSENIEGITMYFSHTDNKGAYFTYVATEKPKQWVDGYWFVTHDAMKKGFYNVDVLDHNDVLQSIYIADEQNGGFDYMQLKPANDLDKGYAYH